MYKLWKSHNSRETDSCICMKYMAGQIIPQTTTIQKTIIDDIINAVDGFEPRITMSSANWKHWVASWICILVNIARKCMDRFIQLMKSYLMGHQSMNGADVSLRHCWLLQLDMRLGTDLKVLIIGCKSIMLCLTNILGSRLQKIWDGYLH